MFKKILLATSLVISTAYASEVPESVFEYIKKNKVQNVKSTPIEGIYQLKTKSGQYIYVQKDGRYAFTAMFDLKTNSSLTKLEEDKDKVSLLNNLDENELIIYPAKGEQRGVLTIFTDTSCPYCTKLHNEVPKLQEQGVKVRYAAFPRGGKSGPGYKTMVSVWCSENRKEALDSAFNSSFYSSKSCKSVESVNKQYKLGVKLKIAGTPASFSDKGVKIDGFMPARSILLKMGL